MSDKEIVLEAIQHLPEKATMAEIRTRIEFLAALREAEDSLDRGEGITHEQVKKQLASWTTKWRAKSSGQRKPSKTSAI